MQTRLRTTATWSAGGILLLVAMMIAGHPLALLGYTLLPLFRPGDEPLGNRLNYAALGLCAVVLHVIAAAILGLAGCVLVARGVRPPVLDAPDPDEGEPSTKRSDQRSPEYDY